MQFNSYDFILIFFPLLFAGYFVLNKFSFTLGKVFLICMGAYFYTYYGFTSAPVLAASIVINYAAAVFIVRNKALSKPVLVLDILANIALLLYFKYFGFILANVNAVLHTEYYLNIILPLGISFFTFQQIAYVLNVSKTGRNETILDYLLYIMFFPKLVMGPITEPDFIIPQFSDETRRHPNARNILCGLKVFSFGLFKKVIIADFFAIAAGWGFENYMDATSMDVFLFMLAYTFQMYFDFSGYSDMAIGISMMLNIDLPINFDSPYKALSIRDYWKNWHMSLTGFLTKNIYFPLGGSKRGTLRTYLNVMAVFIVSGIWHGSNWTYILWGAFHGVVSVLDRVFEKVENRLPAFLRWLGMFAVLNILFLLFGADSISHWLHIVSRLFSFDSASVTPELIKYFALPETNFLVSRLGLEALNLGAPFWAFLYYLAAFVICLVPQNNYRTRYKINGGLVVLAVLALFFGFIHLGEESVFVYFNF